MNKGGANAVYTHMTSYVACFYADKGKEDQSMFVYMLRKGCRVWETIKYQGKVFNTHSGEGRREEWNERERELSMGL